MGTKAQFRTRRPRVQVLFKGQTPAPATPPDFGKLTQAPEVWHKQVFEKVSKGAEFWVWVDLEWR